MCGQVHVGDLIYSIDGKRVRDLYLKDVEDMISGPPGTQVTVVFQTTHTGPGAPSANGPSSSSALGAGKKPGFEVRVNIYGCEGPQGAPPKPGPDPMCCVSLLPAHAAQQISATASDGHATAAQTFVAAPRKGGAGGSQQEIVLGEFAPRHVGGGEALTGQPVSLLVTLHEGGGAMLGRTLLEGVRVGPPTEHWVPVNGPNSEALHLKVWYGQSKAQSEAGLRAAEMKGRREAREAVASGVRRPLVGGASPHGKEVGALSQGELVKRSTAGLSRSAGVGGFTPGKGGLASLWVQAYGGGGGGGAGGNDEESEGMHVALQAKEQTLVALEAENKRLKDRVRELSSLTDQSISTSHSTMRSLRDELADKQEQVSKLQAALDEAGPWQEKLEGQLASAQQLVRGSLLQHQKYEAQIEEQSDEIASLTRDKERLEREVASLRQQDRVPPGGDAGAQTLEQLLDMERRRFKQALADERLRFSEALEREQAKHRAAAKEARAESARQLATALQEGAGGAGAEGLRAELESVRATLEAEKLSAANAISELREQVRFLRGGVSSGGGGGGGGGGEAPDFSGASALERHHMTLLGEGGGGRGGYDEVGLVDA